MTTRPKPPAAKAPPPAAPTRNPPNPGPMQDQRWQRTVRFNWDNGGKRGGNNGGRK